MCHTRDTILFLYIYIPETKIKDRVSKIWWTVKDSLFSQKIISITGTNIVWTRIRLFDWVPPQNLSKVPLWPVRSLLRFVNLYLNFESRGERPEVLSLSPTTLEFSVPVTKSVGTDALFVGLFWDFVDSSPSKTQPF